MQRGGFCGPFAPICRMRSSRLLNSSKVSWNDSLEDFMVHIEWSGTSTEILEMNIRQGSLGAPTSSQDRGIFLAGSF